jgi:hypothetical protein
MQALSFLPALLLLDLAILQIDFIAGQKYKPIASSVVVEHLHPEIDVVEGGFPADVVDDDGAVRIFEIAGDERPESFLAGCVPELQSVVFGVVRDVFGEEVDAHGCLDYGMRYVVVVVELVVDILFDDAGLADSLVAEEDDFEFGFAGHGADGMVHAA